MIKEIRDDSFHREVLSSDLPVLVVGYAAWCADSQRMLPIYDSLSNLPEFSDIRFVQVEVEKNTKTREILGTEKLPTLYLFQNGKKVEEQIAEVVAKEQEEIIRALALRAKELAASQTA